MSKKKKAKGHAPYRADAHAFFTIELGFKYERTKHSDVYTCWERSDDDCGHPDYSIDYYCAVEPDGHLSSNGHCGAANPRRSVSRYTTRRSTSHLVDAGWGYTHVARKDGVGPYDI